MLWFTSDTHFGHANVLGFTGRPWSGIEAMNRGIITNINARVMPGDELYVLGDFSFSITVQQALELRRQIRCRKVHVVRGNHDKDWSQPAVAGAFIVEQPICVLKVDGQKLVMSHYPMADWQGMSHGSWHLHGHIHSQGSSYNEANLRQGLQRYDVGVDANGYAPVSLAELSSWFEGVEYANRVKWPFWVNQTGDAELERDLAPFQQRVLEEDEARRAGA